MPMMGSGANSQIGRTGGREAVVCGESQRTYLDRYALHLFLVRFAMAILARIAPSAAGSDRNSEA